MKLSDIVQYLNQLDTLSVDDAMTASMAEVTKITHIVQHSQVQVGDLAADLISTQHDLETSLTQYKQKIKQLRDSVQNLIEQNEPEYFKESTTRYREGTRFETPDRTLTKTQMLNVDAEKILLDRLNSYSNWQYPGMVIRPAQSPGLESLVAFDPLYLVDTHEDLLSPVRSLFTPGYQRRLRYYVINEYTETDIFVNLPQKQFGLIYVFYYFDFKPLEIIQKYLDEIFLLLRPGGTLLFSFNDCDQWRAVGSAEYHFHFYTPGRLILQHARDIGYEIVCTHSVLSGRTWVEIKKPSVLDSIRGAQTLARVLQKSSSVPEVVDKSLIDLYNELDLDMLMELAQVLNVDVSQDKTKREFNIKKVRRTISAYLESQKYPEEYLRPLFNQRKNK
jgi:SAM-dependent methyltransferase